MTGFRWDFIVTIGFWWDKRPATTRYKLSLVDPPVSIYLLSYNLFVTKIVASKYIAEKLTSDLKDKAASFERKYGRKLCLGIIQVGNENASSIYIRMKIKKAMEVGINTEHLKFNESATSQELEEKINELNKSEQLDGFFIQSPLPTHLNFLALSNLIKQEKDVDGLSALNLGLIFQNNKTYLAPATALAALSLLENEQGFEIEGKHVVVIGRSTIVGKPLAGLLLNKNATVTIAHSKTKNLADLARQADIIITATGKKDFVRGEFIKDGAFVVDCGAPEPEVEAEVYNSNAAFVSQVPGGVGPLTILYLLKNVVISAERKYGSF